MTMERLSGQGYAPIPQSISNTDTEDEDDRLTIPTNHSRSDNSDKISEDATNHENGWRIGTTEPRNFEKDAADSQLRYGYCGDDVPIVTAEMETSDDFWKRREMSTLRRLCLVFSVLLCFATLLIFLYALPCDDASICPPVVDNRMVVTWDETLKRVELHGPISIVHGTPYSLIFLLRGQRFGVNASAGPSTREIPPEGGGVVLSMQGNSGTPVWWVPLKKTLPIDMDCGTFDVDGSGDPDCIVTGNDLLIAIDPTAGTIHWTSSYETNSRLPLIVRDVDNDGIDELLSVARHGYPRGGIILLSGKSGKLLGEYLNADCESYAQNSIQLNRLESNNDISYTCTGKMKQSLNLTVTLNELLRANNSNLPELKSNDSRAIAENAVSQNLEYWEKENFTEYTLRLTPYYRLNVQNFGPCPGENCYAAVNVTLRRIGGKSRAIWNRTNENSYAMRPAIFSIVDKSYVTGFAIKFWQWNENNDDDPAFDIKEIENLTKRRLTERILMFLVNYTNVHEIYASQSEIVQLCKQEDCQPSLKLQTRSITIADLGGDGTEELINYRSSYNATSPFVLTSKVQIVRLDTDLSLLTRSGLN